MNIPVGRIVPILKSLQIHPEAGIMFDEVSETRFTNKINAYQSRVEPSFTNHQHANGSRGITLRQVNDFKVATDDYMHHNWSWKSFQSGFKVIKGQRHHYEVHGM